MFDRAAALRRTAGALLALLPAAVAIAQLGRIHPDEVYQYLEPAYARVHGYGILAWEWREGLRNWAYPGLLAALLRLSVALGLEHPVAYRTVLAIPQILLHAGGLLAVHRWIRREAPERGWDLAVTALVGLQGLVVVYAGRTLGESLSVPLLWLGLEVLTRPQATARAAGWGGVFLGLAVVARYASAAAVLGALGYLALRRPLAPFGRRESLRWTARVVAGGVLVALALGGLDWATWGTPFHSVFAYLRFNVLSGSAAQRFGAAPPIYYALPLLLGTPLWVWVSFGLAGRARLRSAALPLCAAGAYLAALLASPHKEERFVYPLTQLLAFAAAPGLAGLLARAGRVRRWAARGGVVLAMAASVATATAAPDVRGDQLRAIVHATRSPEVRGLLIVNEGLWGAGGSFYIGKRIPWTTCDWPRDPVFRRAMADARINRAVTFEGRGLAELEAAGFRVTARIGRETVLAR